MLAVHNNIHNDLPIRERSRSPNERFSYHPSAHISHSSSLSGKSSIKKKPSREPITILDEEDTSPISKKFLVNPTQNFEARPKELDDLRITATSPSALDISTRPSDKISDPRLRSSLLKKTYNLVLDLDETLINSCYKKEDFEEYKEIYGDQLISVLNGSVHFVERRGAREFINTMSEFYNLFLYSHGKATYVEAILNIIDPEFRINRERIFKRNEQTFTHQQKKSLKNLDFSDTELMNTLILDDQPGVWEEQFHHMVIPSKKFAPLDKSKSGYKFFDLEVPRSDLSLFAEDLKHEAPQLVSLQKKLIEFARFGSSKGNLHSILDESNLKPLKGKTVMVDCSKREKTTLFGKMAERLGAKLTDKNACWLILDGNDYNKSDEKTKKDINEWLNENPMREIKDFVWLCQVYFTRNSRI